MVTACNIQLLEELNISAIVNCTGTQTSAEFYGPDRQYLVTTNTYAINAMSVLLIATSTQGFAAEDTDEYAIVDLHLNDCHTFIGKRRITSVNVRTPMKLRR